MLAWADRYQEWLSNKALPTSHTRWREFTKEAGAPSLRATLYYGGPEALLRHAAHADRDATAAKMQAAVDATRAEQKRNRKPRKAATVPTEHQLRVLRAVADEAPTTTKRRSELFTCSHESMRQTLKRLNKLGLVRSQGDSPTALQAHSPTREGTALLQAETTTIQASLPEAA